MVSNYRVITANYRRILANLWYWVGKRKNHGNAVTRFCDMKTWHPETRHCPMTLKSSAIERASLRVEHCMKFRRSHGVFKCRRQVMSLIEANITGELPGISENYHYRSNSKCRAVIPKPVNRNQAIFHGSYLLPMPPSRPWHCRESSLRISSFHRGFPSRFLRSLLYVRKRQRKCNLSHWLIVI